MLRATTYEACEAEAAGPDGGTPSSAGPDPLVATCEVGAASWAEAADVTGQCSMWSTRVDAIGPCSAGPVLADVDRLILPGDPACKNLDPNAGVAVLSSPSKSKYGDIGVVDISTKGKENSSNTTWREMINLLDLRSKLKDRRRRPEGR
jgi:hypothetical protein